MTAEHADTWNVPGGDIDHAISRSALLDRLCGEIGRDPASITRSIILHVPYDQPGRTRDAIAQAYDGGFRHFILALGSPYPEKAARWVANEVITKSV